MTRASLLSVELYRGPADGRVVSVLPDAIAVVVDVPANLPSIVPGPQMKAVYEFDGHHFVWSPYGIVRQ
jgi:hypothetical protein